VLPALDRRRFFHLIFCNRKILKYLQSASTNSMWSVQERIAMRSQVEESMPPFKSTGNLADHVQRQTAGSGHCTGFAQGSRAIPRLESLRLARPPCMTTPALVDRIAMLRNRFLSVVALPDLSEKGDAKSGMGFQVQADYVLPADRKRTPAAITNTDLC
jgi:hypothetical protein